MPWHVESAFTPAHWAFISERERWARDLGATWAITYCSVDNYPSLRNLFANGYTAELRTTRRGGVRRDWHVLTRSLYVSTGGGMPSEEDRKKAFKRAIR